MSARILLLVAAVVLLVFAAAGALHIVGGINVTGLSLLAAACWVASQLA